MLSVIITTLNFQGNSKLDMPSPDISTQIAGIPLDNCLYNASGAWCTSEQELTDLAQSAAGAYIAKSTTIAYRAGNPKPRYVETDWGTINSMGLANGGFDFYLSFAREKAQQLGKPFFMSVAGLTLENNLDMLRRLAQVDEVAGVELNLSCPNLPGKPQTAYDFQRTEEVLHKVFKFYKRPIGVKLPPYFDIIHFERMAEILNSYPLQFVTCINSIGNGLVIDIDKEAVVIKPKGGFGGIGGDFVKPTSLANVRKFYELLKPEIQVIGCGGVKSGQDAFEHILCGAQAVQIGSCLMKEGASCFDRISSELRALMLEKGYQSLDDFRGKLKVNTDEEKGY